MWLCCGTLLGALEGISDDTSYRQTGLLSVVMERVYDIQGVQDGGDAAGGCGFAFGRGARKASMSQIDARWFGYRWAGMSREL